jgi:hypothetical protein
MTESAGVPADEGGLNQSVSQRKLVDDLLLHLKGLVRVRELLRRRGASVAEIEEHTAEIERLRAELAQLVKEFAR